MGLYQDALAEWGAHADAALAAEYQQVAEWTARALFAEQATATVTAERDAALEDLRTARARVRRLLARIAELEGVEPPTETIFGSSCGAHTYDFFTEQAGSPLAALRSYEGYAKSTVSADVAKDFGRCISINSMAFNPSTADTNIPKVEAYLRSFPTDHPLWFIVSHEPENPSKGYKAAEFVAQQERVRAIVDLVNAGREVPIKFGGNFMAWSARPQSGRDMVPWLPAAGTWDFLAWDGYSHHYYDLPGEVFDDALAFGREHGLTFAIAETGITVDNTPEQRVVWIDQCQQYAVDNDAAFWMYWDGSFWTAYLNTAEEFRAVVEG